MKVVLDASVVLAADVPRLERELAISAATPAELHFGVLSADDPQRRPAVSHELA